MARFCTECGNPLDEGAVFCDNCGAKLDAQPAAQPRQKPAQTYGDSYDGSPQRPIQQPRPAQTRPQQSQPQGGAQPPKKNTGLIIGLIAGGIAVIAAVIVIILVVLPKLGPGGNADPTAPASAFDIATEAVEETPTAEPTEEPTEAPTEEPTEPPTEAPTEAPLPFIDSLAEPAVSDFAWIADAMSGSLEGQFIGNDALTGKWKCEIIYDGVWELAYLTIDNDAHITIEPIQINYGDGWEAESGLAYEFRGAFDISSVNGAGEYGSINLYTFIEIGGTQYGVGTFSVHNTSSADVYLVRP